MSTIKQAWDESLHIPNTLDDGGDITVDRLIASMQCYFAEGIPPRTVFLDDRQWNIFLSDEQFKDWFDPATRAATVQNGQMGSLLGLDFITDRLLPSEEQFIRGAQLRGLKRHAKVVETRSSSVS